MDLTRLADENTTSVVDEAYSEVFFGYKTSSFQVDVWKAPVRRKQWEYYKEAIIREKMSNYRECMRESYKGGCQSLKPPPYKAHIQLSYVHSLSLQLHSFQLSSSLRLELKCAGISRVCQMGCTAAMVAARLGKDRVLHELLRKGGDPVLLGRKVGSLPEP